MQFDNILVHIGAFGKYQKTLCVLIGLVSIPVAWHAIGQVFLAAKTDHWCALPPVQSLNCTDPGANATAAAWCLELQKELSIPFKVDKDGKEVYSSCERYETVWSPDDWGLSNRTRDGENNQTMECDHGWEYDRSQYETTVIQDFNLVCSKQDLAGLSQSVFFAGLLTGSFIWGGVADWCGRKLTFIISLTVAAIVSIATSFAPNFATYTALRFFIAGSNFGVYLIAFVLATEIVGPAYRSLAGTLLAVIFSVGYAMLAVVAYLIREWRHLQLAISLPWLLFFLLILIMPESPRWLISKKKYKEAKKAIKRIAKINGRQVPEHLLNEEPENDLQEKPKTVLVRQPTYIDLFRTPNMRKKTLNIFFNWFVNSLVYYGLSLSTSDLGVDDYVAAFVSGAVELPAYLSSWITIQMFGRRLMLFLYLIVGGVACITTTFIPPGAARATVAMLGKFAISGSFNIIYIYSVELYPTPVRSMGMGASSMAARLSGVIAPFILIMAKYWAPIPLLVFGGSSLLAGFLALLLPETNNRDLPETIQEGEEYGKGERFSLRSIFKKPAKDDDTNADKNYAKVPTDENNGDQVGAPRV